MGDTERDPGEQHLFEKIGNSMIGEFVSKNGALISAAEAVLPIDSIELLYGFGVYETLKLRNNKLFFVDDHIDRLMQSAEMIGLEHSLSKGQITEWITALVEANKVESTNIKMLLLGGDEPTLHIFMVNPIFVEKKEYRDGVHAITFPFERFMPQAKSLNMLGSYVAYQKAKRADAWDAILVDHNGNAVEGTRSNFFVIKEKTLYTAPLNHVLDGITRKTVIACAEENGYTIEEKLIPASDIFSYDGAFLTNTSGKIVPLKSIDDQSFEKIHEPLTELRKFYNEYLKSHG